MFGLLGMACGDKIIDAPVTIIPLDEPVGRCADVLSSVPGDSTLCLYFLEPAWPCVHELVGPPVCNGPEDCDFAKMEWVTMCPEGQSSALIADLGSTVDGVLAIVPGAGAMSCPLVAPEICNHTTGEAEGADGCIAKMPVRYVIDEDDGRLKLGQANLRLDHSGYLREDLGLLPQDVFCESVPESTCSSGADSCVPESFEVLSSGPGSGRIRVRPLLAEAAAPSIDCPGRCEAQHPHGRKLELNADASPGAVLARITGNASVGSGCNQTFPTPDHDRHLYPDARRSG